MCNTKQIEMIQSATFCRTLNHGAWGDMRRSFNQTAKKIYKKMGMTTKCNIMELKIE